MSKESSILVIVGRRVIGIRIGMCLYSIRLIKKNKLCYQNIGKAALSDMVKGLVKM